MANINILPAISILVIINYIGKYYSKEDVTDLIIAVAILLERDINRLVVEVREVLELVKL
jgi:hypothetical protein